MIRKYFISGMSKTFYSDGTRSDGSSNGLVTIDFPICDSNSLRRVEELVGENLAQKDPDAEKVVVLITSFQLIATNPW